MRDNRVKGLGNVMLVLLTDWSCGRNLGWRFWTAGRGGFC
jgi:hypothetical protein